MMPPSRLLRLISRQSALFSLGFCLLTGSGVLAADDWTDVTTPLMRQISEQGLETAWPGGCSGVVVNRLNGEVAVKVVGLGLWRSSDTGKTWTRIETDVISGRDETGWATNVDPNQPTRITSFSLDGAAGWSPDGVHWKRFADLGRNWDYGSVDWSASDPQTIIAAKHETDPPGEVYVTTDGGRSWKQLSIHLQKDRTEVSMVGALGPSTLIYSNGSGIHRSTDLGQTWSKVSDQNPQTRIPVSFNNTFYLGTKNGLLASQDVGVTWEQLGDPVDIWLGPFFGKDETQMVVVGKDGVFRTADQAESWTKVADLKPGNQGFQFTPDWFGCYAWDPVNSLLYASSMGNPVYQLKLPR